MSETNAPEPTMEEILASIRRIISEDDAPAPAVAEAATSPGDPPHPPVMSAPEPAPEPPAAAAAEPEDVLELTDKVPEPTPPPAVAPAPPMPDSLGDIDFGDAPSAPAPEAVRPATPPPRPASPRSAPVAASAPPAGDEPLVSAGAAGRAADHFGALASSISMPAGGRTLEDVVRELLRPLLKEWLDQNLATIVEARVQDEVERISRRRSY